MTPKWYVPRRTILRGVGAGVALPFLEAMVAPRGSGTSTSAAAAAATPPRRFVGMWGFPNGLVHRWDPLQNCSVAPWTPSDRGGPLVKPDDGGFLQPFWDK